jgi:hypothetical protein
MKDTIKKIIGFLMTALAGALGYAESVEMFLTIGAVFAAVYAITNLVKEHIPGAAQVLSWVLGIAFSMLGWYLDIGIFTDMTWWFAAITGFIVSLSANGVFDNGWLETAWLLLKQALNQLMSPTTPATPA